MKLAVAGKGGAGKTTFSATAARVCWRAPVMSGCHRRRHEPEPARGSGRCHRGGGRPCRSRRRHLCRVGSRAGADRAAGSWCSATHTATAPDGVRLLRMGMPEHADEGCLCSAHAVVSALAGRSGCTCPDTSVLDMEASPEHLSRGTARHAHTLVLVAEPYFRSLEAVKLQAKLAAETAIDRVVVVANKCRTPTDVEAIGRVLCRARSGPGGSRFRGATKCWTPTHPARRS